MRFGRLRPLRAAAGVLAALSLVVGGPLGVANAATPTAQYTADTGSDVMRIATSGFVDSFNPFTSFYLAPTDMFRYMYENLVQYGQDDGTASPGLAEKWETSSDGKTWTFHIRSGMKWSDGKPETAKDVAWTYNAMLKNPDTLGIANWNFVSNFKTVTATNDTTLVIKMKEPQAANPGFDVPIVPEHVWSKIKNPDKFLNDKNVVGSGPFILTSYQANQHISLKANPNYWQGKPKLGGLEYIYYTNPDAQVTALRAGEVDFVSGLSPNEYNSLQGADGIETNSGIGRRFTELAINPGREDAKGNPYGSGSVALHDKRVRQAIRLGTDKVSLMQAVLQGEGVVANSFMPASISQWAIPADDASIPGFDPDAAKKLLDEAGWKVGSDGIREKDGKKLRLRLDIGADEPDDQTISDYFKPWMKNIGIDIKVNSSDSDTNSANYQKGDFDLQTSGWSVGFDPDYQLGINTCASRPNADGTGPTSQDGYCNPAFDKLFKEQHSELNVQKRQKLVRQALKLWTEDTPGIALWYANSLEAWRSDRFQGFEKQPTDDGIISFQSGYYGYKDVAPVAGASSGTGVYTGVWVVGGIVVAIAIIGGGISLIRRRTADDRP